MLNHFSPVRPAVLLLALLAVGGLTGCCSFERDWRQCQSYAYPERELAGCWEGTWQSDYNGHHGGLRAIITKEGENYYRARFKATYAVIVPYQFETPLLVTDDGQIYTFEGSADLGWLAGGVYTYNGHASATDFVSNYCAENKDHGTFTMTKIQTYSQCGGGACCVPR